MDWKKIKEYFFKLLISQSLDEFFANALKAQEEEIKVLVMVYGNSILPVLEG